MIADYVDVVHLSGTELAPSPNLSGSNSREVNHVTSVSGQWPQDRVLVGKYRLMAWT